MNAERYFAIKREIVSVKKTERCFTDKFLRENENHVKLRQGIAMQIWNRFRLRRKWDSGKMLRTQRHLVMRLMILDKFRESAFVYR